MLIHHTKKIKINHKPKSLKLFSYSSVFRFLFFWFNVIPTLDFCSSEDDEDDCSYDVNSSSDEKYFTPFVHCVLEEKKCFISCILKKKKKKW